MFHLISAVVVASLSFTALSPHLLVRLFKNAIEFLFFCRVELVWIPVINIIPDYLNYKPFSHELKILNYDGLRENKKLSDENQWFNWIKSIHWCRLVNIGWLADIDLFKSMIWLNHNPQERKPCGRIWLKRVQTLQILWNSVQILKQALNKLCRPLGRQLIWFVNNLTIYTCYCKLILESFTDLFLVCS